jgi:hypothetical protein
MSQSLKKEKGAAAGVPGLFTVGIFVGGQKWRPSITRHFRPASNFSKSRKNHALLQRERTQA